MTSYVSFRSGGAGRSVSDPFFLTGDGTAPKIALRQMNEAEIARAVNGRDLLFGVHGFNTSYASGALQMAHLERALGLGGQASFFGVLWPGDFVVPVINYPFEAADAVACGRKLAKLCNTAFAGAASVSFMSHSLGGRVILEAAARLDRKVRSLCLTAAAVDRNVLTGQYSAAVANSEHVYVLSSVKDLVLKLAYPAGDFFSDIFGDGDSPVKGALGLKGPPERTMARLPNVRHHAIDAGIGCNHSHYLYAGAQWQQVAAYARRSFERSDPNPF